MGGRQPQLAGLDVEAQAIVRQDRHPDRPGHARGQVAGPHGGDALAQAAVQRQASQHARRLQARTVGVAARPHPAVRGRVEGEGSGQAGEPVRGRGPDGRHAAHHGHRQGASIGPVGRALGLQPQAAGGKIDDHHIAVQDVGPDHAGYGRDKADAAIVEVADQDRRGLDPLPGHPHRQGQVGLRVTAHLGLGVVQQRARRRQIDDKVAGHVGDGGRRDHGAVLEPAGRLARHGGPRRRQRQEGDQGCRTAAHGPILAKPWAFGDRDEGPRPITGPIARS